MYQVGMASYPMESDTRFDDLSAAIADARAESTGDRVVAVWHWKTKDSADVVCLVYQGDVYERQHP